MSYKTPASPYWPLGTKVKVTYEGKSAIGVVEDFGPAEWAVEWAVAQHSPSAGWRLDSVRGQPLSAITQDDNSATRSDDAGTHCFQC